MLTIVQANPLLLLPPIGLKNSIRDAAPGHRISAHARIGPVLVTGVGRFEIAGDAPASTRSTYSKD